jgi:sugar lactone lactonase YvrE
MSSISRSEVICCAPTGDRCGEGVLWHAEEQAVYWTDINRFLIHRYLPARKTVESWFFDEPVTAVLLTASADTLLVCLGSRVILWKPATDARTPLGFELPGWPSVRLNDAAIDPRGSLLAGSMRNNVNSNGSEGEAGGTDGKLFRIDPAGEVTLCEQGIGISNTLVWSPDQRHFYFADSLANEIWVYHYDSATGTITKAGTHFAGFERGAPDGSAMDKDGYLWNCRYGGSCIVRVSPNGAVDQVIEMPVKNITNCTFGGPDRDILYITTAASSERLSGSLFMLETKTAGLPENRFRL